MHRTRNWTRRDFLRCATAAATGSFSSRAALGFLTGAGAATARAAVTDYRALVCIFLGGGNDGFNMLIPTDGERYASYQATRRNLAIARDEILELDPGALPGQAYGIPGYASPLRRMYNDRRLAFVVNAGTLLQPTTKADYQAGRNLPPQLFSHNDQSDQWMSSQADAPVRVGWGGRIADLLADVNGSSALPLGVSLAGNNIFQVGEVKVPYVMSPYGVNHFNIVGEDAEDRRSRVFRKMLDISIAQGSLLQQEYGKSVKGSIDLSQHLVTALEDSSAGTGVWPYGELSEQLQMVARIINVRAALGMRRQVFYVTKGGFDTHDGQLDQHPGLINEVADALEAFHSAMDEFGVGNGVTSFTMSDFGRTLTSNGDGSDHSWANVHVVTGGAVAGGAIYGTFPDLTINGPDDAGEGRLIPTVSVEQYGSTLARWFGVDTEGLHTIFPHLNRFPVADLGFMA